MDQEQSIVRTAKAASRRIEPIGAVIDRLVAEVKSENRRDVVTTCETLAKHVECQRFGKTGKPATETAIRGMLVRADSRAGQYVADLRERGELVEADRVLRHELARAGDKPIKLRIRDADVYAAVSPEYVAHDLPDVAHAIRGAFDVDADGFGYYDPAVSRWGVTVKLASDTPRQVGEPVSIMREITGKDCGDRSVFDRLALEILWCLNGASFALNVGRSKQRHTARVMRFGAPVGLGRVLDAFERAKAEVIDTAGEEIQVYRGLLQDRSAHRQLVGLFAGRSEDRALDLARVHVEQAQAGQRRALRATPDAITRLDVYHTLTAAIRDRRGAAATDAQAMIGDWFARNRRPIRPAAAA